MILLDIVIFIAASVLLVKSSGMLSKSLVKVSSFFRLNEFAIGIIVLSISTSMPELFIGIVAARNDVPMLALGNIIGSNIVDLTLVAGIVTVLGGGIKLKSKIVKKDLFIMTLIVLLPVLLIFDGYIFRFFGVDFDHGMSRLDGFILIGVYCLYIWNTIKQERLFRKTLSHTTFKENAKYLSIALLSIFLLLLSARFTVEYAIALSDYFRVPEILIGLFVLSIGSSIPEIFLDTKEVLSKHQDMAIEDIIGSVIANSTLVIGITSVICPFSGNVLLYLTSILFMLVIAFLFMTFAENEKGINWRKGVVLILFYVFFVIVELYVRFLGA